MEINMKKLGLMLIMLTILLLGCGKNQQDPRIKVQEGVASDTFASNIVTKPVLHAFSALIGERIDITNAVMRRNAGGFMELQIEGHNDSYNTVRFQYKIEWVDADGVVLDTKASVWKSMSAVGKSNFHITDAATRTQAVDFRMNTRPQE
jgi:uncharacterized protein YcfL